MTRESMKLLILRDPYADGYLEVLTGKNLIVPKKMD
jgi:hypothetical protein